MTIEAFLSDQLLHIGEEYELTIVTNSPDDLFLKRIGATAEFVPVAISRQIDPIRDIRALISLIRLFRNEQFDLVHSITPKAGLLSMCSAFIARVPFRVHTFTGQVWATKRGLYRFILKSMDRLLARCATNILVDSPSQRDFLLENRVVSNEKASVLGSGSISGVDLTKFFPDLEQKQAVRAELDIPSEAIVFLYVGRMNRDKGIPELLAAFERAASKIPESVLVMVGPDEEGFDDEFSGSPVSDRIKQVGYTTTPGRYMAGADVFILPSHREGFGSTVIEAAATGVPAIASRIYGLTDAVQDGETGILFEAGDIEALSAAMVNLAQNESERLVMGAKAKERAVQKFSMEAVTANTLNFYREVTNPNREVTNPILADSE